MHPMTEPVERELTIVAPHDDDHMIVKRPIADMAADGFTAVRFDDAANPECSLILDRVLPGASDEDPDMVQADLEINGQRYRVRLGRYIREAARVSWEFVDEHPKTATVIGGLATGAVVAIWSLYVIREKHSNE